MSNDDQFPSQLSRQALDQSERGGAAIAPFGVGAFVVARNWSERKQIESYVRLGAAKNALLRVYNEQCDLLIARGVAFERLENIDAIRESERLRIRNEVVQRRFEADIAGLQASVRIENLKAELAEAKQRRERIENPTAPPPPPPKKSEAEKVAERLSEINAIDALMKAQRAAFVTSRGGADKLTADDAARLEKLDVAHSVHMESLYQDLFQ